MIEIANMTATDQGGGKHPLLRSFALSDGADRAFNFREVIAECAIKNPEAFGLRVGMFRAESNRPSRPPVGANNHDAAGNDDSRLGERDKHLMRKNLAGLQGIYARIAGGLNRVKIPMERSLPWCKARISTLQNSSTEAKLAPSWRAQDGQSMFRVQLTLFSPQMAQIVAVEGC